MNGIVRTFEGIRDFFEAGGDVLWIVLFITILMWTFIIERLWYYRAIHPGRIEKTIRDWQSREDQESWFAKRIREQMISEVSIEAHRFVILIKTLIAVLPLVGLLGTVTGMIQVFDVMAVMGTGNAREMAGGVSAATLPTMAGMVAALSGLYFGTFLDRKAKIEVEKVEDELRHY
ncbi:MAG: MotA/TolQ/ExbB proton channel family protein [Gammaproteobacteria bacterium]|nr:MotA/TolQ/ExbB proton channel family protein [Gammaproteobacteria bacterium]